VWLGHLLSGYSLPMTDPADGKVVVAKRGEHASQQRTHSLVKGTDQKVIQNDSTEDVSVSSNGSTGLLVLETDRGRDEAATPDLFEHAVREAFQATRRAFPGGRVLAHIDLK
jgi:hypothetical protein